MLGLQVDFPNKCVLQSLNIAYIVVNSADHDDPNYSNCIQRVHSPLSDDFNHVMPLGPKT